MSFLYRFPRLQWSAVILLVLLQRAPMLRSGITTEFVISSSIGSVLKSVLASAAALGTVPTVAGATTLTPGS